MKRHDIPQCLRDIRDSIDTIEEHLTRIMGGRRDFNVYMQDKLLRQGVERNLEIIGEAVNRILRRTDPAFVLANSRSIVDLRNRVIHSYGSLEDQTIWGIVIKHLPPLKAEVERLLG
jgi:uncharacterized protein with HEPN domain